MLNLVSVYFFSSTYLREFLTKAKRCISKAITALILDKFRIWTRVFSSSTEYIGALSWIERTLKRRDLLPEHPILPSSSIFCAPTGKQTHNSFQRTVGGKYWIIDARCHEVRLICCVAVMRYLSVCGSVDSCIGQSRTGTQDATGVHFDQRFCECFCHVENSVSVLMWLFLSGNLSLS